MNKLSVLVLTPTFPRFHGDTIGSTFVMQYAQHLAEKEVKITVITSGDKTDIDLNIPSLVVQRFYHFWPIRFQRLTYFADGIPGQLEKSLLAIIQLPIFLISCFLKAIPHARGCDVIHAHWVMSAIPGLFLKWIYGKPLVITVRENDPKIATRNLILRWFLIRADSVTDNTNEGYKEIISAGVDKKRFHRILNGVNPAFYKMDKNVVRHKLSIPEDKIIIIFVGFLINRKSPVELLDVFIDLKQKYYDLMLVYVGGGQLCSTIEKRIKQEKISHDVHLTGQLTPEEISTWLNASDIFCLPTKKDGIPNAMVEAMACEVPVVSTKVGGIPEIIKHKESGMIVSPGNSNQLKDALEYLIVDEKRRNEMGKSGKQVLAEHRIDWKVNAKLHINIYDSLKKR